MKTGILLSVREKATRLPGKVLLPLGDYNVTEHLLYRLQGSKYADEVVPQKTYSPLDNLILFKPNILMESTSHSQESIDKLTNYMKSVGGRVVMNPYYKEQSSTKIKNLIKNSG